MIAIYHPHYVIISKRAIYVYTSRRSLYSCAVSDRLPQFKKEHPRFDSFIDYGRYVLSSVLIVFFSMLMLFPLFNKRALTPSQLVSYYLNLIFT